MEEMQVTPTVEESATETKPVMPVFEQTAPAKKEGVGFWAYLGMIVLFSLPVAGFIACFVMMFAPQNQSIKNFARAAMAWMVISVLLTVLCIVGLVLVIGNLALPAINDALGEALPGMEFSNFTEVIGLAGMVMNSDYSGIISTFKEPLLEQLGEEFEPLIDEIATGDYDPLIAQLKNREYTEAFEDIKNGEYERLEELLGKDAYQEFVGELEKAADEGYSETLDEALSVIPDFF